MVWTARIDLAPIKQILIVSLTVAALMLIAVILGQAGPRMYDQNPVSAFHCKNNSHFVFDPVNCDGEELGTGVWSRRLEIETRQLNKFWYCVVTMFTLPGSAGIQYDNLQIETLVMGKKASEETWTTIANGTVPSYMPCPGAAYTCPPFILVYEQSINYDEYGLSVKILNSTAQPVAALGDVVFNFIKINPEFAKMALILKVLFLGLSIGLFAFHYLKLKGKRSYWQAWTDEQKLFVFLLLGLVGLNNPFYALEFITQGWFIRFLGSFLELVFTCVLFIFWFVVAQKLYSDDNEFKFDRPMKVAFALVGIYALISAIFEIVSSVREASSPLYGVSPQVDIVDILYYITSILYISVVLAFFTALIIILQPISQKKSVHARFIFFGIPTVAVIISVLVGIFTGTIGTFGRDAPSFVYYLFMYNIYVYFMLWGYWPVEKSYEGTLPTEKSTLVFTTATERQEL